MTDEKIMGYLCVAKSEDFPGKCAFGFGVTPEVAMGFLDKVTGSAWEPYGTYHTDTDTEELIINELIWTLAPDEKRDSTYLIDVFDIEPKAAFDVIKAIAELTDTVGDIDE